MDDEDHSAGDGGAYRHLHEQFVSGHNGTTVAEIVAVGLPQNLSVLLFSTASLVLGSSAAVVFGGRTRPGEYLLLCLPILLALTCCSHPEYYWTLSALMAAGAASLVWRALSLAARFGPPSKPWSADARIQNEKISTSRFLPFVTNYRSTMLITTSICILAVDFPVYPRRFAKTENFGFGLMDLGVGSFVFAAGLVSQEARKGSVTGSARSRLSYLRKSLTECVPMLALGLARYASVKGADYHEHVTEYGVHWNFFFTLAVSKAASSLFFALLPPSASWPSALVLSAVHQYVLQGGLGSWVLSTETPRTDLFSANREGFCSVPGYVAIYLAGVAWGAHLARMGETFSDCAAQAKRLALWSAAAWASLLVSQTQLSLPASRRLANLGYFNWMVAYNLTLLAAFLASDLLVVYSCQIFSRVQQGSSAKPSKSKRSQSGARRHGAEDSGYGDRPSGQQNMLPYLEHRVPHSLRAVSANGLAYFLLANLMTGAVNLCLPTIEMAACPAILVVAAYMFALHCFAVMTMDGGVRLKAW